MRAHTKTIITTLLTTTALALALTATTANARSYSVNEKEWEILFRSLTFEAAGNNISCPLTLLGHFFERTIAKVVGQVGVIKHAEPTTASEPPCTGGRITILNETLPWRINYISFTGRLPNITSLRQALIGVAFRISTGGLGCLAGTTAAKPAFGENLVNGESGAGRGGVTGLRFEERTTIPLQGSFMCEIAGESSFRGTGTVLNLPQNASITVRLI